LLINSLVGTMGKMDTEAISSYLKLVIVSRFNDYLGQTLDSILNLPGKFDALSSELQKRLQDDFAHFGLRLTHLYITSITPPDEVQNAIDDKSKMELIKDMEQFLKLKSGMAIEKAATSQGEAGAGLGMGMGMLLPGLFANVHHNQESTPGKQAVQTISCPDCKNEIPGDSRFCPRCGHQQLQLLHCAHCGKNLTPKAKFCSRCGKPTSSRQEPEKCRNCNTENLPDSLFCNNCGEKLV